MISSHKDRIYKNSLIDKATTLSMVVAFLLIIAKLSAFYLSFSLALLSSLIDSILDGAASSINYLAARWSRRPADGSYRFGYGKLEALAGLFQALLILGSIGFLIWEAIDRLITNDPIGDMTLGIYIMLFSLVLTIALVIFQHYVIQRTHSLIVRVDAIHYRIDILVNIVVVLSMFISHYYPYADAFGCLVVSIYLLKPTLKIARESIRILLDHEIKPRDRTEILSIIKNHPHIKGFHNFRTRSSGQRIFLEAHLEMDGTMSLIQSHGIVDAVKKKIEKAFPHAEVILHQDPINHDDHPPIKESDYQEDKLT